MRKVQVVKLENLFLKPYSNNCMVFRHNIIFLLAINLMLLDSTSGMLLSPL